VVIETWLRRDGVRWLLGCEPDLARHLPSELAAQVPGLSFSRGLDDVRQRPTTGRELRTPNLGYPLRLDIAAAVAAGVMGASRRLGRDEQAVVQIVVGPSQRSSRQPTPLTPLELLGVKQPAPDASERRAWAEKITEPRFGVRLRVGAVVTDRKRAAQIVGPLVSALSLAGSPHARLVASFQSSHVGEQLYRVVGRARSWSSLINASELAMLCALPIDGVAVPGRGHDLAPAPRSLLVPVDQLDVAKGDRLLGISQHPRDNGSLVRLPAKSTTSHVALTAPTGSGKSVLLANWCVQDAEAGRSLLIIEPKGDLVSDVLSLLPANRHDDVVVIEPSADMSLPVVGINPLAGPLHDAERRADSMLHLFRAVFGSAIGPRSADLLLHTLIMAARLDDGSLVDVIPLLTNDGYRRRVLAKVSDPLIIAPWAAGFDSLSEPERARVIMPVLNKLRAFLNRAPIRRLIGQGKPRFSLDELFTSPKIVLVSLNAGIVGPETAKLLGSIVLSQFWEAIERQASVPPARRRSVMAVVDELADYASGLDFAEVLAKARGMNVSFTVAHQHLRQLNPNLRAALSANARNRVSWRPARDDAKALADIFGVSPDTLLTLPAFHAVAQVLVDNTPSQPFIVKTLPLPEPINNPDDLRRASAARYGIDPAQLDADLLERWQGGGTTPQGPVGMTRRRPQG
jgi:hypothetical protein